MNVNYELKALKYAEKYGIIEYRIENEKMIYTESFSNEGTYLCTIDLTTMKETRKQII